MLQRLTPLLEPGASLVLTEKGEAAPLPRHPEFRLFAAMNPATDAGKKDLPPALRARFTEVSGEPQRTHTPDPDPPKHTHTQKSTHPTHSPSHFFLPPTPHYLFMYPYRWWWPS